MTTECKTENRKQNPIDARIHGLVEAVSAWNALIVGALAVVLSNEIAAALPLSNFHQALALLPVTLAVLYGLLWVAVALERRQR